MHIRKIKRDIYATLVNSCAVSIHRKLQSIIFFRGQSSHWISFHQSPPLLGGQIQLSLPLQSTNLRAHARESMNRLRIQYAQDRKNPS
jgi:hypothetical protein